MVDWRRVETSGQEGAALFCAYVEAGATHILLDADYSATNTDDPWNFAAIERLTQWREARNG